MKLCLLLRQIRAAAPEPLDQRSPLRIRGWRADRECPTPPTSNAFGRFSKLLGLTRCLGATLIVAALAASAQGQSSVTLAWDPSAGSGIAGYRLYEGVASRTYTDVIAAGNVTARTVAGLVSGATYFFAVTAYDTDGLESDFSTEISYTVPFPTNAPPTIALTSPANGTVYTAPATFNLAAGVNANGHSIIQVQFYNGATLLGTVTAAPYSFSWNNVSAGACSLSAKVVYDSGSTVGSAAVNVTVVAAKPASGLTFAADSGAFSAPFVAADGTVFQSLTTPITTGGRAVYTFNVVNAGNYLVCAMVSAPSEGQNSFYVNIDAEPTDPLMIWDVPVSTGLASRTVSWRGNGDGNPASPQYMPKVFTLFAGSHQLIVRGREANTTLGTISIAAAPPTLQIQTAPGGSVVLSGKGQAGQMYYVLSSQNLKVWTVIDAVKTDPSGSFTFTDPAGTSRPGCLYRLQGQ